MKGKGGSPRGVSNAIAWACRTACAVRVILFGNETGESGSGLGPIEDKNKRNQTKQREEDAVKCGKVVQGEHGCSSGLK
jgi:hypothetical protein